MGRASKELKEVVEKTKVYPVEDEDYYIIRVRKGGTIPPGWIHAFAFRNYATTSTITQLLDQVKNKSRIPNRSPRLCAFAGEWAMFVGPRPDKRWGPVCP